MTRDFIAEYLHYCRGTEVPAFYRRWCAILGIAGILGRSAFVRFGSSFIYPNVYCMLMGESGARKSTAIKDISRFLKKLPGMINMAPAKSSKEGFTLELTEISNLRIASGEDILNQNLFGDLEDQMYSAEIFVAADEFNTFLGLGNTDFAAYLGDLWDHEGLYRYKLKNSKQIIFKNATINILGGNTIENLMECFPPQILSQGFFSRMIFVHSEKLQIKIHAPHSPPPEETQELINLVSSIKANCTGEFNIPEKSMSLLKKIYETYHPLEDMRFKSYSNRRYTHLLKICIIVAASRGLTEVTNEVVITSNTILNYTEQFMPRALGEFGAGKGSGTAHKVVRFIDDSPSVVTMKEIWKHVYQDLNSMTDLSDILRNLCSADRIQITHHGFLPNKKSVEGMYAGLVDYSLLTQEERNAKI